MKPGETLRTCEECGKSKPLTAYKVSRRGYHSCVCLACQEGRAEEEGIFPTIPQRGAITCAKHGSKICGKAECQ